MENGYIKRDKIGRDYTKILCEQNKWEYSFVDNDNYQYSAYDSFINIEGINCMAEIKKRDGNWDNKGYILEVFKLERIERILNNIKEKVDRVLYINWVPEYKGRDRDKICYVWTLGDVIDGKLIRNEKLGLTEENKRLDNFNAHTVESRKEKAPKWVWDLFPNTADKHEKQADGTYKKVN